MVHYVVMARSQRQMLGPRRQYTVNQSGAPEPETNEGTVTLGRQSGEKTAEEPKPAPKKS